MSSAIVRTPSKYYSGFDPRTLGDCFIWFDAADTSTITGTSQVTAWANKGSISMNAVNRTGSCTSGNVGPNGLNFIRCPAGTDMQFTCALTSANARTWFFVVRNITQLSTTIPTSISQFIQSTQTQDDEINIIRTGTSTYELQNVPNGQAVNYLRASVGNPFNVIGIFTIVRASTTAPQTMRQTGATLSLLENLAASVFRATSTTYGISEQSRQTGIDFFEILYYNRTLSLTEYQTIEGYLAWKWGVSGNVPVAHPYKLTPVFTRGFQPIDIVGCGLWLDAADPASLTLSGSNVTTWLDKSGNARNATGVNSPTYSVPSVVFGGSGYFTVNLDFLNSVNHYSFIVLSNTNFTNIYGATTGGFGNQSLHVGFTNSNTYRMNFWGSDYQPSITSNYRSGQRNLLSFVWINNTSRTIFANGALEATTNITGSVGVMRGGGTIGNVVGQGIYTGVINEIVIFAGVTLSSSQREQIEGYLTRKWNISNASATHSFRLFPPLQPIFTPLEISNCSAWYDGADPTTVTLVSSRVSQWNDKSGNGRNATQSTESNRPSYSNSGIVFDRGVSGTMHLAISIPYNRSHNIFMVATTSSASQTYYIGRAQTLGGGPTFIANFTGSSLEYYNNTNRATFTASPSGTFLASYTQASGGRILGFYNGTSGFDIAQTNNDNASTAWSTIGNAYLTVYTNTVTGSIYELIFYVGATLTAQQRQRVEGYLAHKWGLQGSLPTTHPYRRFKP